MRQWMWLVALALPLGGCFGDLVIACDFRGDGADRCQERRGTQAANPPAFEALCGTGGGDYLDSACPAEGIVAGCREGDVTDWYYAPLTRAEVVMRCEGDGTVVDP